MFDQFELLDVFGPLQMFGMFPEDFAIRLIAESAPVVASTQGPRSVIDDHFADDRAYEMLLIPGGMGTRREVGNAALLDWLRRAATQAEIVASVCTGSALLAKAGLLDGRRATTNKLAFDWIARYVHFEPGDTDMPSFSMACSFWPNCQMQLKEDDYSTTVLVSRMLVGERRRIAASVRAITRAIVEGSLSPTERRNPCVAVHVDLASTLGLRWNKR